MDSEQFDRWTRYLDSRMSRRSVSALTASLAAAGFFSAESEAKKKKKKKKSKAKNIVPVSPPPPPPPPPPVSPPPVSPPPSSCTPQCAGKACGPDNCGGVCATCGNGQTCTAQGQCLTLEVYELDLAWGNAGISTQFIDDPYGLAVDSDGKLYIADNDKEEVIILDSNGEYETDWGDPGFDPGEISRPHGLALDKDGFLYEVDNANGRIQKFTRDGNLITTWGDFGEEDGEFDEPLFIAVDSAGNVFVTDIDLHRVQKFSQNALDPLQYDHVWSRGSEGSGPEQFNGPVGIAVDSTDRVYVVDNDNNRVQILSNDGDFLGSWGTQGTAIGQFDEPGELAIDAADRLYIGDFNGIQKFTTDGQVLGRFGKAREEGFPLLVMGIAVGSDGGVYVSDVNFGDVHKYIPATNRHRSASTTEASQPERKHRRKGKQRKARGRHRARG